ncbi:MAG: ABC transporter substrate-binding protein [Deinococcota bacterium]
MKKALSLLAFMLVVSTAFAQTVLSLDEVPVGELDPAKASDYADSILMFNLYDTLVLPTQGGPGLSPHLATDWSADGNSYTFNLRDDVMFQSGNPFTAEDVVFSFERMQALGAGLSFLFGVVESATTNSEYSVTFTLSEPNAPFVSALIRLPIVDKALVMENLSEGDDADMGDWGSAFLSGTSAGTGAYSVVSHNPQEETVMAKNADYFLGVADLAPDTVRLRYGLEAATVRTLISNGEHDISSQWLPPEVLGALARDGAQLLTEAGTGAFYFKMNTQKAPLDDANCRLALANAFDYESAVRLLAVTDNISQGSPASGAIPVGMLGSNPAENTLSRNLAAAREHMTNCPYSVDDFVLEISWIAEVPIEERLALLMQANFNELGINSEIQKLPWASFSEQVSSPETTPHISQLFVNAVTGDPDTLLYGMYHSSNPGTWQSPEYLDDAFVDSYLDQGRQATDEVERAAAYTRLNERLMEIAPTIYGFDRQSVFAASSRVSVPAMTDPSQAFGVDGLGFSFRLMEMQE